MTKAIDLGNEAGINFYIIGRSYLNIEAVDCENAVPWLQRALLTDADNIPAADAETSIRECGGEVPTRQ